MRNASSQRGASLPEIIVSSAIMAIIAVSILSLTIVSSSLSRRASYEYIAANIAKSRIEDARGLIKTSGFAALTNDKYGETDTKLDQSGIPDENGDFRRTTTVTTNYNSNVRLTSVSVDTCYYLNGKRSKRLINMTTLFVNM